MHGRRITLMVLANNKSRWDEIISQAISLFLKRNWPLRLKDHRQTKDSQLFYENS